MSRFLRLKSKILLAVFVLNGVFALTMNPNIVQAYHATSSYDKLFNDTLTSQNWNDLFDDFVNTWLPVSLNGPVGIATVAPASGLDVNGLIKGTSIYSTGNVGIGVENPTARLEVVPASGYSILAGNFKIGNVALPTADSDAATKGYVDSFVASATSSISTLWDGSTAGNIWSLNSGNVGIGTTAPTSKLEINDVDKAVLNLYRYNNFAINTTDAFAIDKGGTLSLGGKYTTNNIMYGFGAIKGAKENATSGLVDGYLSFMTTKSGIGSREWMRITSAGNVGIGTTSPSSALEVNGVITSPLNTGTVIKLGTNVDSALAAPVVIDMGGTYSNSRGLHPKLMLYKAAGLELGFGFTSGGHFEYITTSNGDHVFYSGVVVDMNILPAAAGARLASTGVFGFSGTTAITAADTGISRLSANKIGVGNGTQGNYSGALIASNIGIGTTTPVARLEVVPVSSYSILVGNFKIGNVALPTADADAATKGYVDSFVASATSSITSIASFIGVTSATYSGNNGGNAGYAYAHAQCAAAYSGSHVCAAFEILNTIKDGGAPPDQDAWIFNGPPAYTALANDCDARTSGSSAAYGAYWQKPATGYTEGRGLLIQCNNILRLACCQ